MNRIGLVGKPNAGKSSLFNLLTGLNQKIGNYSGVTVERKSGQFSTLEIEDLPGLKSLKTNSPEERISKKAILSYVTKQEPLIFVLNGMLLEDGLMLFSEVADLQVPMILVVNFKDDLIKNSVHLDQKKLSSTVGCPVFLVNSRTGDGFDDLKNAIVNDQFTIPHTICRSLYDQIEGNEVQNKYTEYLALERDLTASLSQEDYNKRQKTIIGISKSVLTGESSVGYLERAKKWDKILLHPISGLLIFLLVLFLVFQAVFSLSSYPMDWIDSGVSYLAELCKENIPLEWLANLLADAIIAGIGGVIIFIPQIAILFFFLGVLEHTGYLSRISYISDAFLRKFGLTGKSIIPLMSSWACAIPAIMSTRVIDDPKERMAVIMASPLMTCSARLPVYTILIAVVFTPEQGYQAWVQGLALLILYLLGVVATLAVSWYFTKTSKIEGNNYWSLELPIYRFPNWRNILFNVYHKTKSFVLEAGKIILLISILIWLLSSFSPKSDAFIQEQFTTYSQTQPSQDNLTKESFELEYSYLGYIGKAIEPAIAPLGYDWKIGIALVSSFAAREVFVGTLSTIYSIGSEEEGTIVQRLQNEKIAGTMKPRFDLATSVSLLLFYVFAMQCMSTLAIVRKETQSWKLPVIQFFFMTALAYIFALFSYMVLS